MIEINTFELEKFLNTVSNTHGGGVETESEQPFPSMQDDEQNRVSFAAIDAGIAIDGAEQERFDALRRCCSSRRNKQKTRLYHWRAHIRGESP